MVTVPSHFESFLPLINRFKLKTSIFQEGNGSLDSKSPVVENLLHLISSFNSELFSQIVNYELFFLLILLRSLIDSFSLDRTVHLFAM